MITLEDWLNKYQPGKHIIHNDGGERYRIIRYQSNGLDRFLMPQSTQTIGHLQRIRSGEQWTVKLSLRITDSKGTYDCRFTYAPRHGSALEKRVDQVKLFGPIYFTRDYSKTLPSSILHELATMP